MADFVNSCSVFCRTFEPFPRNKKSLQPLSVPAVHLKKRSPMQRRIIIRKSCPSFSFGSTDKKKNGWGELLTAKKKIGLSVFVFLMLDFFFLYI